MFDLRRPHQVMRYTSLFALFVQVMLAGLNVTVDDLITVPLMEICDADRMIAEMIG